MGDQVIKRKLKKWPTYMKKADNKGRVLPGGRPKGCVNKRTAVLKALGPASTEEVLKKAMELALNGDVAAIRLILDRVCPAPKGRLVQLDLPYIYNLNDLGIAMDVVTKAMADGKITSDEALSIGSVLEKKMNIINANVTNELLEIKEQLEIIDV